MANIGIDSMELHNLALTNSIANHFVGEMRNKHVQTDRMRFRKNMKRLGSIMAYEFSKTLSFKNISVETPLGEATSPSITNDLYLITVLRAGMPFYEGFLDVFDHVVHHVTQFLENVF